MSELRTGATPAGPGSATATTLVVDLHDRAALDRAVVGGKAASLAHAAMAGIDALPGVILTTTFSALVDGGAAVAGHPAIADAIRRLGGEARPLIARSSSVHEDTADSSMAGQLDSIADITGATGLAGGVQAVLASRVAAGDPTQPIAVLVQPMLEPRVAGVMFGADPVSGRSDRRVVAAVLGSPAALVSGEVDGARYLLDERGRVVERSTTVGPALAAADLHRLVALSARVAEVFGAPQDIEWAIAGDGRLWLLQSRPVTTEVRGVPQGPVYGPGPIAETFPEPLTELEHDLWVPPLREAVRAAVALAGTASRREVARSAVVVSVRGHVGIDLRLAGDLEVAPGLWRRLNPAPAVRRLRGAWRVGRLRAALPSLAEHLLGRADADLREVPALGELSDRQLVGLMHRSRDVLRALHAHEILMGMLTDAGSSRMTGASVALRVLAEARDDGFTDTEILERSPVVLALTAPRVAPHPTLPSTNGTVALGAVQQGGSDDGVLREALRLRVRWVQELSGRAAWELGTRLVEAGDLPSVELVRHLTLDHVDAIATKRAVIVPSLVRAHQHDFGHALPTRFRLSDTGHPIRVQCTTEVGGGTGAGGGIGRGPVTHDAARPPEGSVLVTGTLTPGLGPVLERLQGIVAETGSVLSHLAILAREAGVATVVGYAGAVADLPDGTMVTVDGETGRVTVEDEGDPG